MNNFGSRFNQFPSQVGVRPTAALSSGFLSQAFTWMFVGLLLTAGITLALDFPIKEGKTFPLVHRLADMTREFGGRLYPAKDAAMTPAQFQAFYPQWEQFARFRDPLLTSSLWQRVTADRPNV